MAIVCPAVLASDTDQYHVQMEHVARFAERIQIDLTDGSFAANPTVSVDDAWWPVGIMVDFHLMFQDPSAAIETIIHHQPHMIIVHAEAEGDFVALAERCKERGIKMGVALLPETPAQTIFPALPYIDHVLIFSGHLGHFGGSANLQFLEKIAPIKSQKPFVEIGWDGGINDQNVSDLVMGGVDILNVGGFIQNAEAPEKAFARLQRIADESGTT